MEIKMALRKSLIGLIGGAVLLGNVSGTALASQKEKKDCFVPKTYALKLYTTDYENGSPEEPEISSEQQDEVDRKRQDQLKKDLREIYREDINLRKTEIETLLYSKDGAGYIYGISFRPQILPKHFRFNAHLVNMVNSLDSDKTFALGMDFYGNFYLPNLPSSPFVQVGLGSSYFERIPESLVTNLELHTTWKAGFINSDGFYLLVGLDHWSNAGIKVDKEHPNKGRNAFGVTIGMISN